MHRFARRHLAVFAAVMLVVIAGVLSSARAAAPVEEINTQNFSQKVLESPIPVVLQFDAKWCPYCRKVQPLLAELAADKAGQVAVYRLDIDKDLGIAQLFGVKSLPTIVLIKKGMEVSRIESVPSKAKLYLFAIK